jgi:sugar phosphate permease
VTEASELIAVTRTRARDETAVIWVVWLTYGAFYFCRANNFAAALPGMQEELHLSNANLGLILGALKLAYGAGQFVNGQLAERFPARWLLAIGMLGSAALNLVFGFGAGLYFLVFVWACNGYSQSLGWTPCVRVLANWIPVQRRGRAFGIVGTGYQAIGALTYAIAGVAAAALGWRGALYLPAALLAGASVFMLLFLRESPGRAPGAAPRETDAAPAGEERAPFLSNLIVTLANPALWLLALSLALLNACRYGFVDWGIAHLKEVQHTRVDVAAIQYMILPLGGIAGSLMAGWVSDRFFGARRAPVICLLLALLGALTLAYGPLARVTVPGTLVLLALIGFAIFGPQVLLVGTAPADLARRGTAAAAAGFVDFMGYMGAALGGVITGNIVDRYGWPLAVRVWAGWAFAAAIAASLLWNARAASSRGK